MPIECADCHSTCALTNWPPIGHFHDVSCALISWLGMGLLGFDHLREWFTELGNNSLHQIGYQFITKDKPQEEPNGKGA
jgi:hypothetical protein